jgi:hypothetical protein
MNHVRGASRRDIGTKDTKEEGRRKKEFYSIPEKTLPQYLLMSRLIRLYLKSRFLFHRKFLLLINNRDNWSLD